MDYLKGMMKGWVDPMLWLVNSFGFVSALSTLLAGVLAVGGAAARAAAGEGAFGAPALPRVVGARMRYNF